MSDKSLISRMQWWSGWCIDHEVEVHELAELRLLLDKCVDRLRDEE